MQARYMGPETSVYVIEAADLGYCKIGVATDPDIRVRQLQTGSPTQLILIQTWQFPDRVTALEVEQAAHRRMTWPVRLEWFFCEPKEACDVVDAVAHRIKELT